jgi:indole-3-glycerol phosphate synthase
MATHTAPILDRIVAARREWIARLKDSGAAARLPELVAAAPQARDFRAALTRPGVALIAECKQRSPSGGVLQTNYDPAGLARRYAAGGAAAISVLTEPEFFGGDFDHLQAVRAAVEVPVLCKDFLLEPVQLQAARAAGADAVLLIVALLDDEALMVLHRQARSLGMQALVEAHEEAELDRALRLGATLIGINNRDLTSMRSDKETTARLRARVPAERLVISESGIDSAADIDELARLGVNAALVGESLLRAPDLEAKLRELTCR